ncbi:porin [Paraburkholderia sediminicola]|uniref:porin n=1 Tax=Paraburkholderia sediminicola TaxID=458836 RepID=UPI0038B91923
MKKPIVIAAAILSSSSAQSFAQNSVTLYGVLDDSIQYAHNAGGKSNQIAMVSGQLSGSRWGLKGVEDLGGGLQAVFRLENGFDPNTGKLGQGGRMFGRQAYVGLSKDTFGTVTLGRQYDALFDLVFPAQGNYFLEYFAAPGDVDIGDGTVRQNNAIKWASPDWSGFRVNLTYSLGNVAGAVGSGQSYSGAMSYTTSSWVVAAGYIHIDNGNPTISTRGATSSDSIFESPVNSAYSTAKAIDITRVAANYTVGPVTFGGYYSFSEYLADAASTFSGSERYNNGSIFALWQVSPPFQLELGYDYMKSAGDSSATYHTINLAADCSLSKRTDIYGIASYGHAAGQNGLGPAQAVISDTTVAPGNASQELLIVGIRHRF